MQKRIVIIALIVLALCVFIFSFYYFLQKKQREEDNSILIKYSTLKEYENSINYQCTKNSDCDIKDVHNCCGGYPKCVNKRAKVDPDFVRNSCKKEGLMSVCGFPTINSCICNNGKCEGRP